MTLLNITSPSQKINATRQRSRDPQHADSDYIFDSLAFVGMRADMNEYPGCAPRDFWRAFPSGNRTQDCYVGHHYGYDAINYMRNGDCFPLLGWILQDMVWKGPRHNGLVCGFATALTEAITNTRICSAT